MSFAAYWAIAAANIIGELMRTTINSHTGFSTRAILDLLKKNEIAEQDLTFTPLQLEKKYTMAEAIGAEDLPLEHTDIVVALSGRGDFNGTYSETANKFTRTPNTFDPNDTINRLKYAIDIAKQCTKYNKLNGIKKPVYVYFNGVDQQNEQLSTLLHNNGSFHNYPAHLFIIDSCPLGSTIGQVIALGKFLEDNWPKYSQHWNLSRAPNMVIVSSSYHVPRIELSFGNNSPLFTADFWLKRPELAGKLEQKMHEYVLAQGTILKSAALMVIGSDRQITANPSWEKDLLGDMPAVVNYSSVHRLCPDPKPPSIAAATATNIVTLSQINLRLSLRFCLFTPNISVRKKPRPRLEKELELPRLT